MGFKGIQWDLMGFNGIQWDLMEFIMVFIMVFNGF